MKRIKETLKTAEDREQVEASFDQLCQQLLDAGVRETSVNQVRGAVNYYTSRGIDPTFRLEETAIYVQGQRIPLIRDKEYAGGLGVVPVMAIAGMVLPRILDGGQTFGAVFRNKDLSCWNASYSKDKAKKALGKDLPYMLAESGLEANPSTETLDKFLNMIGGYISDSINGQKKKFAKCTREGYAERQKGAEEMRKAVISTLEGMGLRLKSLGQKKGQVTMKVPSFNGKDFRWGYTSGSRYTYEAYEVIDPKDVMPPPPTPRKTQEPVAPVAPVAPIQQPTQQPINHVVQPTSHQPVAPVAPIQQASLLTDKKMLMGGGILAAVLLAGVVAMKKK
jgi:hypothetical protein